MSEDKARKSFFYLNMIKSLILLILLLFVSFGYWYLVTKLGLKHDYSVGYDKLSKIHKYISIPVIILSIIASLFTFFYKIKKEEDGKKIFFVISISLTALITISFLLGSLVVPDPLMIKFYHFILVISFSFPFAVTIAVLIQGIINYLRKRIEII